MGLSVSHNAFSGAYSSFMVFRFRLAEAAGMDLMEMEGYGGDKEWDMSNPLTPLLNHSDCDGEIEVKDLLPLAEKLREVAANRDTSIPWVEYAVQFADGCENAARLNEPLVFS